VDPMESPSLDVRDEMASVLLVPKPIQLLRHGAKLNDEVAGQILGLDVATFFLPKPVKLFSVIAHDDSGV
jgi:hypothetical protein